MAVTTTTASNPLVASIIEDIDSDTTVETAISGAQFLYFVEITNPNDVGVYTKIFNSVSNSTTNQTQHYLQLYCPATTTCYMYIPASLSVANGIQFYTSLEKGTVQSQTNPTSDVTIKIGTTTQ
jgi:hypothetical protein|tara:strand:+ start:386 stop:757 length:372 start_codon:yes stop_codon:yes gene_type:complete